MHNENRFLEAIQSGIQRNARSWEASLSHITSADLVDLHKLLGYSPGRNEPSLAQRESLSQKRQHAAPGVSQFDWRNANGNNYVSSVKKQGFCASCVAFGVTASMETRARFIEQIPENGSHAQELPDLSPAQLFYCGKTSGYKCFEGWEIEDALEFASSTGVVPEACFPYPDVPVANNDCTPCAEASQEVTVVESYTQLSTPEEMKDWIATKGPAITGFSVYLDLYFYHSGVYTKHDDLWNIHVGGHCVAVIGYDEEKQAWLAKNSWGSGWGDAGFFYIGYNQCGFDALMWGIESFKTIYKTQ